MSTESFYPGSYSSFDTEQEEVNLSRVRHLSMATDPRTANQIAEVTTKLNTGVKNIEVSTITPEIFESIPTQHLKEIKKISELVGAGLTVHGIMVEPSGITQQGFSEVHREGIERQMLQNVERAAEMGGQVVTFHSTAGIPETDEKVLVKDEQGRLVEKTRAAMFIDPRSGRMRTERDVAEHYLPTDEKEKFTGEPLKFDPKTEIKRVNEEGWRDALRSLNWNILNASSNIGRGDLIDDELMREIKEKGKEVFEQFPEQEKAKAEAEYYQKREGEQILRSAYREMRELFDMAYKKAKTEAEKNGDTSDLNKLHDFAKQVEENRGKIDEKNKNYDPTFFAKIVREGSDILTNVTNPDFFIPLKDFVMDKSSQTFGDVAFNAWDKLHKKMGDKVPIVSIENPPAGSGISRAEDMEKLILASRKKFEEKAMASGYSKQEAEKAAEKMIGATWDVGHINMIKKYGYTDKELIKEAEKISKYVKHVHLSDNFGMEHTELPMGMGNVPLKGELEKLKKAGFKGSQVIEVGNWWQHFKSAPVGELLESLGSPIYSMKMSPYWNQARAAYGNYFTGYGPTLPEQHFSMYGGGFSALPQELGGQIPGRQSRFSGSPND